MHLLLVITLFLFIPRSLTAESVKSSRSASIISSKSGAISPSICSYRTINYITHTLPQQCLRTDRAGSSPISTINNQSPTDSEVPEKTSTITQTRENEAQLTPDFSSTTASNSSTTTVTVSLTAPLEPVLEDLSTAVPSQTKGSDGKAGPDREEKEVDVDLDSSLDNSNFLSFEEWKSQNLAKAGQSSENIGNRRTGDMGTETRRRPGSINNALESLGEDGEIDLDFGDFVSPPGPHQDGEPAASWKEQVSDHVQSQEKDNEDSSGTEKPSSQRTNGKGAGTTYTERFNYASFDCAATVLKTSSESKGSTSILVENKDSYMLTACSVGNKFLIVELCNDILVDTVVLANYEFFSSIFRTFRISVSGTYPAKADRWKDLGTFKAKNSREVQPFKIDNPLIWARYLRVEFLTHFGNEYYCPVSLLRVHGTTMMEEFKNQGDAARADDELDEQEQEQESTKDQPVEDGQSSPSITQVETESNQIKQEPSPNDHSMDVEASPEKGQKHDVLIDKSNSIEGYDEASTASSFLSPHQLSAKYQLEKILFENSSSLVPVCATTDSAKQNQTSASRTTTQDTQSSTHTNNTDTRVTESKEMITNSTKASQMNGSATLYGHNGTVPERKVNSSTTVSSPTKGGYHNASDHHRSVPSATHPSPANPTTQESFFKTIQKRLQLLEANSSLSLQYIEEQSRILRDAFVKVEKKQTSKAATFLEQLNSTVLTELRGFRIQYDQIWQSTVLELESQRERADRELLAVSSRLTLLADEIIFQKRLSIVQSLLLLLCLGFVIFSRSGAANSSHLELPLLQNILSRSQSTLRIPFESPLGSPTTSRPNSSRYNRDPPNFRNHHRRQRSDSSYDGTNINQGRDGLQSPAIDFSPPTPTSSHTGQSETSPERQMEEDRSSFQQHEDATSLLPGERLDYSAMPRRSPMTTQSSSAIPLRARGLHKHSLSWHDRDFTESGLLQPEHARDRRSSASRKSPLTEDSGVGLAADDDSNNEESSRPIDEDQVYVDGDDENKKSGENAFPTPPPEDGHIY